MKQFHPSETFPIEVNALLTQQKQTRRSRLPLSQLIPGWVQVALFGWMICWGNHPLPRVHATKVEYVAVGTARIDYSKSSPEQSDGRAERERASQTDFATAGYYFAYGGDGLLYYRQGPYKVQNISRDGVGRVIYSSQSMSGTTYLNESISWYPDSTQISDAISRNGATNSSDNRSYVYDLRSRLTNASFGYPVGNTAVSTYQFDGGASGGLGLRTSVLLSGLTGVTAESYGTFGRLGSMSVSGALTNNSVGTPVAQSYDAAGNVTTRTAGGSTDTLTWDAFGQLVQDVRTGTGAFTWSAVYDGLGRRLQTTQGALTVQSSYDPEIEFLELVTTINGVRNWHVTGPDLDGRYGGLNGCGGIEAIYNQSTSTATYVLSDTYGHGEGVLNGTTFTWNPSQSDGYGALAGSSAASPIIASSVLGNLIGWRGHYIDATGLYYLGARYYAPDSGTFLSPDPLGHSASMDLYSYCNGDPVNGYDPDGRFGVGAITGQSYNTASSFGNLFGTYTPLGDVRALTAVGGALNQATSLVENTAGLPSGSINAAAFMFGPEIGVPFAGLRGLGMAAESFEEVGVAGTMTENGFQSSVQLKSVPSATGYRLISSKDPNLSNIINSGTISANPKGTYFSWDNLGDSLGSYRAQIPRDGNIMVEFNSGQLGNNIKIPLGENGTASHLEPVARDYPQFGFGGASQRTTTAPIQATRIIDRTTGQILYEQK